MNQQTVQQASLPAYHDEQIVVVKRSTLFPHEAWHGINNNHLEMVLQLIGDHKEFQPRGPMEEDPTYKQIIPYLIFRTGNRYFIMQRRSSASEQRLKNKFTLGIGGHMRAEDMSTGSSLFDWARREFNEEVSYQGSLTITPLGIINDDSNPVGQVHLGIALLVEGTSADISVKSELKEGFLVTLEECAAYYDAMESWSQMVYDLLVHK